MKLARYKLLIGIAFVLAAAFASAQGISVTINGQAVQFSGTGPQMVNDRVLVPLRGVFEKLGAYVEWHAALHEVVANRGQDSVRLQIGNPSATVNGQAVTMDVPAQIIDGSTMVPIRFVSEAIGAQVGWRAAEQMVIITSGQDQPPTQPDQPAPTQTAPADSGDGPVRMAYISSLNGSVTWRPGDDVDWTDAAANLPLRQGAEIWVNPGSKAEIQFDDGSLLNLNSGAVATLQTMYSDNSGEFTEIRLNTGTASLSLASNCSRYQIDTPMASVTSTGVSSFRIDASNGLGLVVQSGQAQVQGDAGQVTLQGGQSLRLMNASSRYVVMATPGSDDWDRYCEQRHLMQFHRSQHLPSSIAIVGGDLDSYGTWIRDPQNGYCWHPGGVDSGWAPYRNGHWVWVSPFGWTWCGNEPWGWAPYHYGTWFPTRQGWLWRPGPAQQCWSPAVVHFSTDNGNVAWCPLAPAEVRYPPAVSVGFRIGNWAVNFSIGGAACYTPETSGYCTPHAWNNVEVNRTTNIYNVTRVTNITNVYVSNNGFVPRNSRVDGGATIATTSEFGGRGSFTPGSASNPIFVRGKSFAPPTAGGRFAGPTNVRPTAGSFSSTGVLSNGRPSVGILNRAVVQAPPPPQVMGWTQRPMPHAHIARSAASAPPQPRTFIPRTTNPRVTPPVVTPPPGPTNPPRKGSRYRNQVPPTPPVSNPPVTNSPVTNPPTKGSKTRRGSRPPVNPGPTNPPVMPVVPPPTAPPVRTRPVKQPTPPPVAPTTRTNPPTRQRIPPPGNKGKTPPRKPGQRDKKDDKGGGR